MNYISHYEKEVRYHKGGGFSVRGRWVLAGKNEGGGGSRDANEVFAVYLTCILLSRGR